MDTHPLVVEVPELEVREESQEEQGELVGGGQLVVDEDILVSQELSEGQSTAC